MQTLYKYRTVSERTAEIFSNKKVWLARPATLNDPFECRFEDPHPGALKTHEIETQSYQLQGFIMTAYTAYKRGEHFFGLHGREIKRLLNRIKRVKSLQQKYNIANTFLKSVGTIGFSAPTGHATSLDSLLSNVGVFSLTEEPANMLMWSHYAGSHSGLAIGFSQTPESALGDVKQCRPVNYTDEARRFDFTKRYLGGVRYSTDEGGNLKSEAFIQLEDDQVQEALFSKTTAWAYEKEWRYVTPKSGLYNLPAQISEIVFGLNCSPEIRRQYVELVRSHCGAVVALLHVVKVAGANALTVQPFAS